MKTITGSYTAHAGWGRTAAGGRRAQPALRPGLQCRRAAAAQRGARRRRRAWRRAPFRRARACACLGSLGTRGGSVAADSVASVSSRGIATAARNSNRNNYFVTQAQYSFFGCIYLSDRMLLSTPAANALRAIRSPSALRPIAHAGVRHCAARRCRGARAALITPAAQPRCRQRGVPARAAAVNATARPPLPARPACFPHCSPAARRRCQPRRRASPPHTHSRPDPHPTPHPQGVADSFIQVLSLEDLPKGAATPSAAANPQPRVPPAHPRLRLPASFPHSHPPAPRRHPEGGHRRRQADPAVLLPRLPVRNRIPVAGGGRVQRGVRHRPVHAGRVHHLPRHLLHVRHQNRRGGLRNNPRNPRRAAGGRRLGRRPRCRPRSRALLRIGRAGVRESAPRPADPGLVPHQRGAAHADAEGLVPPDGGFPGQGAGFPFGFPLTPCAPRRGARLPAPPSPRPHPQALPPPDPSPPAA